MKKIFTTLFLAASVFAFGQTQIANAGFENWGGNPSPGVANEPNSWYSNESGSSTAQLGPQTCFKETSGVHTGTACVRVENKVVPIIGTIVNGNVTTGVVNAPTTNKINGYIGTVKYSGATDVRRMNFTGRPDSLVGWYKYTSGGTGETGKVTAILHNNQYFDPETPTTYHADPTPDKIARATFFTPTGTNATWTRFSVPFVYTSASSPAYVMVNITSSANQTTTFGGSKMWIDDLQAIYNPVANFDTPATICPGATATFTDQSTATPTAWAWSFPGASPANSSSQNPGVTYAAGGTYSVTLTATYPSGTVAVTKTVSVNAAPNVTVNSSTICAGQTATLTAIGATTYSWNTSATTASISVTPASTTMYTVTGTDAAGCSAKNTATVTISASALNVNAATICSGGTVALVASGANTYTWTNPASNSASITVSPTVTTSYTVSGTNALGCVHSITTAVNITSAPSISVNSATICSGSSATLTASGVSSYSWTSPVSNSAVITVSPTSNTTYTVTGTAAGCVGTYSATGTVVVNPTPVVSLAAITSTPCAGGAAIALSGTPSGGTYSGTGVASGSFTPASAGSFTVTYSFTNTSGCSASDSKVITVDACVGIEELQTAGVKFYPNPVQDVLYINTNSTEPKSVEVYDLVGKKVISLMTSDAIISVDSRELTNGIYIVKIQSGNAKPVIARFMKN
jgi:PKD repeat protein